MSYSLLLVDYDGTLCDSNHAICHSMQTFFQALQLPPRSLPDIQRVVIRGLSTAQTLQALQPQVSTAEVAAWVSPYRTLYTEFGEPLVSLFPGTREILTQADARGIPVVVVSNNGHAVLESSLARFNLLDAVNLVIGDGSFPNLELPVKPDPTLYWRVIQPRFPSITAGQTLMIGDTATDLLFARNCGIDACWATYGNGVPAACEALAPTHRIQRLSDVLALMTNTA